MESLAQRVRDLAQAQGINSGKALGDRLRLPSSSADNYWKGTRPWPIEVVPLLALLFDTSTDRILGHAGDDGGGPIDLVTISEIDLAYGLGGTFSDMPVEAEIVRFDRAWLESITRTPPALLTFARGRGDSMQPTLQDGDIVLIDRSVRTVREDDAIWALTIGDIAMIKRLRVRGERVHLLADNTLVPNDEVFHEEVNVVGRVIFIGRKI